MEKSKVYFTSMRTLGDENLPQKLSRLIQTAGIGRIDFAGKFVAIKLHFGEPGNLAFLRPNYAKVVADLVRKEGGNPFLTDCNTLYVGGRKNALDHLDAAYENGFSPLTTGCQVLIADGLRGTDETVVPLPEGELVKEARIGKAVMEADIVISLNHFKGHEMAGFGGAIKNLGMGCGSRAGKMAMHSDGKPHVLTDICVGCGRCQKNCAHAAITIADRKASIDHAKCVGCGRCIGACPCDAVAAGNFNSSELLGKKMAEYTLAVVKGRPGFHITLAIDISPNCDCHSENDIPIVPDIGMFASFDPVALDRACADAVNAAPIMAGSILEECDHCHGDHFTDVAPISSWHYCLDHAEKIGLGSQDYELITI